MSNVPGKSPPSPQQSTNCNKSLSRTGRYKRKKKLYIQHEKEYPDDTFYELLKIPAELQEEPKKSKRFCPEEKVTACGRLLDKDDTINTHRELRVENEHEGIELKGTQLVNLTEDGINYCKNDEPSSINNDCSTTDVRHGKNDEQINPNLGIDRKGVNNNRTSLDKNLSTAREDAGSDENSDQDIDDGNEYITEEERIDEDVESDVTSSDEEWNAIEDGGDGDRKKIFSIDHENNEWSLPMVFKKGISKLHMIMTVIAISLRGNLTYTITLSMLKSIKSMTVNSGLPSTMRTFWRMLTRNDDAVITRQFYCQKCTCYIGGGKQPKWNCMCKRCGPEKDNSKYGSYFVQVAIEPQLRQLFSDADIVNSLGYRYTREKKKVDTLEDIYDGAKYMEHCKSGGFLSDRYNFSFTMFLDGVQVSKSSNVSAWPILLAINELPPHARKKYTILAGIWVDAKHPNLQTLLLPTIKEIQSLYHEGIRWTHPINNNRITSRFIVLVCTADSVARPDILNMTRFNGKYGCTFCYAEGVHLKDRGVTRVYPVDSKVHSRTNDEIRQHMKEADRNKNKVFGVKGSATVAALSKFDLACGFVVDSMHNVYLGVTKYHTLLLLDGKSTDAWYAGQPQNILKINSRLLKIRPPSKISRKPRPISDMKQWKASEWRNWIQHYALPCLNGIIRDRDLKHLTLLSRASYILNTDCISANELATARKLLDTYVKEFQKRFGITKMRFNIHLLTHLSDSVANWGPFWTHSTFPFESWNKKLMDKVTSATARPLQITTRFFMARFLEDFLGNPQTPMETKQSITSTLSDGLKKRQVVIDTTTKASLKFIGIGNIENRKLISWESELLRFAGYEPEIVSFYKRAQIRGIDYRCREADKKETRFCNKYIYCQSIGYGEILNVVSFNHNDEIIFGLFAERLQNIDDAFDARHIKNVENSSEKVFVTIDDAPVPAILIDTLDQLCITRLPNIWETD